MSEPTVRRLLPRKRANELPEWNVELDGKVIGRISEHHLRGASARFFAAIGVHPETGLTFPLELSTDFDERVAKIHAAYLDPERFVRPDSWGNRRYWPPLDSRMTGLRS